MSSIAKKITLGAVVVIAFVGYAYETYLKPTASTPTTADNTQTSASSALTATSTTPSASGYKDGTYTGSVANAYYGNLQVSVNITGGKIANVTFLQAPDAVATSRQINGKSSPELTAEAIAAQSAKVDIISGATQSSEAFQQSLQSALDQAKA